MAVAVGTLGTLGGRIRAAREAAGFSLDDLAERSGLPAAYLASIEDGYEFSTVELDAIAAALGSAVDDLLLASDTRDVLMRAGDASQAETKAATNVLARFVRDYEFLRSLDE